VCCWLLLVGLHPAWGQETPVEEELPPPVPFAVINAASVDRLMTDAEYVFEAAERPELMDWLNGMLGTIGDLKGVDRSRPFGAYLFLDTGLPPVPFPVVYVPVSDEQQFLQTLSLRGVVWKASGTADNRYESVGRPNMKLRFSDGYAFLVRQGEWILDEELPEPVSFNEVQTSRYDVSASLRVGTIPAGIRSVFLGFLRASSEAELQQRDNEPDAAYRLRRANGLHTLEMLEIALNDGDDLTAGWDASRDHRTGVLEVTLTAKPDSEFAKMMRNSAGQTTSFRAIINDAQPLSAASSTRLDDRTKKAYQEILAALRAQIELDMLAEGRNTAFLEGLEDSLGATFEEGNLDLFAQVVAAEPQKFVILGGARIVGGATFGAALTQLLTELQSDPDAGAIDLNLSTHQGVVIHRLGERNGTADEGEQRFFGGNPSLYLGTGPDAVWLAIGTDEALRQLQQAIDLYRESAGKPDTSNIRRPPFQLVARLARWLQLPANDRGGRGPSQGRQLAEQAFTGEDDALRIEMYPTETGLRIRIQLDEGFLRLIGLALGRQYDRSQL
jgi:hypothetical protein